MLSGEVRAVDDEVDEQLSGQGGKSEPGSADEPLAELKCWELRSRCSMKNQSRETANCPAYRKNLGCWEVDWRRIVEGQPASQQEYWLSFLSHCDSCVAYQAHPEEMQSRIDAVRAAVFND
jgi:hypothetical protein